MKDMLKDPMIVRQMIMDHYQYPRNHQLLDKGEFLEKHMDSESCIDDIKVQMVVKDNIIKDIRFDGIACTISTASTSIMTELLMDKTLEQAQLIINEYNKMINDVDYDEDLLESAIVFSNVNKQANRINCATIGWEAAEFLIEKSSDDNVK
ncbi:MAG: SUF system NifU family Fe-S cluster assembly protein [Erysipelothrix sp.]|nr:SUF system NifU family Fe-S cluster assembly protein [Erysipelothrix sp.]